MMDRVLFECFAKSYDPPDWIIESLEDSPDPAVRSAVTVALGKIPQSAVDELDGDTRVGLTDMFRSDDQEKCARLHLLSCLAVRELHRARVEALGSKGLRPKPYDIPILEDLTVNEEGLVPLAAFDIQGDALCYKGQAFFVLKTLPSSGVNYWLLGQLARFELVETTRVRLDPILYGPASELAGNIYKMYVYGRPLDWDRICNLREADHGRFEDFTGTKGQITDYAWVPHDGEVSFYCEELPRPTERDVRGARYLHAVYDKKLDRLVHLDGAIRTYTDAEYDARSKKHVRVTGKVGRRTKVFRTDQAIDADKMGALVQAFFVWNDDVGRYFG